MERIATVVLLFSLLAVPLAATAAPALSLAVHATTVTASGATPNSPVVIFSMARVPHLYWSSSIRRDFIISSDASGTATYDAGGPIPFVSIWVAVDLKSGHSAVGGPSGYTVRSITLADNPVQHGNNDSDDHVRYGRGYGEFLWVRPGVGAWALNAGHGSVFDEEKRGDGGVTVAPLKFTPIGNSPPPGKKIAPHDVVVIIDPFAMEIFTMEVDS